MRGRTTSGGRLAAACRRDQTAGSVGSSGSTTALGREASTHMPAWPSANAHSCASSCSGRRGRPGPGEGRHGGMGGHAGLVLHAAPALQHGSAQHGTARHSVAQTHLKHADAADRVQAQREPQPRVALAQEAGRAPGAIWEPAAAEQGGAAGRCERARGKHFNSSRHAWPGGRRLLQLPPSSDGRSRREWEGHRTAG